MSAVYRAWRDAVAPCRSLAAALEPGGPGETQLETDRRKINLRIDHIKTQLDAVRRIRHQQRQRTNS